mgnify:CR=1 FL=1
MRTVEINGISIGANAPCFIIAEIGSNHNGDLDTAKNMIKIAKENGADAVKFQIFKEKTLYPSEAGKVDYLKLSKTINELVRENEVPDEYHLELLKYCNEIGISYLCTPTDEELADYLDEIGVSGFKIASYALTHVPLLKHIAKKGKPILLLHGFDSCFMEFRRLAPFLINKYQLIIPDLFGFGFCPRPKNANYDKSSIISHLTKLINELKSIHG